MVKSKVCSTSKETRRHDTSRIVIGTRGEFQCGSVFSQQKCSSEIFPLGNRDSGWFRRFEQSGRSLACRFGELQKRQC